MIPSPPDQPGAEPLRLSLADQVALDKARSWAKVSYIPSLVVLILLALALIPVVLVASSGKLPGLGPLQRGLLGFGWLVFVAVTGLYVGLLRRYIKGIEAHQRREPDGLVRGFRGLRGWFIYMVVAGSLSVTFSMGMLVYELLGFTAGAGP